MTVSLRLFACTLLALRLNAASRYPEFDGMPSLRRYVETHGVGYLDFGASKGGSRAMLETIVRGAGDADARVLGLDLDEAKLAKCNLGATTPKCGRMDLAQLKPEPLVKPVMVFFRRPPAHDPFGCGRRR